MTRGIELPPLPRDVAELLEAEKRRPAPDAAARQRMAAGIAARLGLPDLPPGGDGGPAAPTGGGGTPGPLPAGDGGAATMAGTMATSTSAGSALVATVLKPVTLVAFGVGAIAGAGTTAVVYQTGEQPVAQRVERISQGRPAPPPPAVVPPTPEVQPPPVPSVEASSRPVAPPRAGRRPPRSSATALAAERQLLEMARTALGRGRAADALSALRQHRREHPRGQLVEEREALSVIALAAAGRQDAARRRAARFARRFPRSLLLPSVRAALKAQR